MWKILAHVVSSKYTLKLLTLLVMRLTSFVQLSCNLFFAKTPMTFSAQLLSSNLVSSLLY